MTGVSPHLRLGNDALSHQANAGVLPAALPVKKDGVSTLMARRER